MLYPPILLPKQIPNEWEVCRQGAPVTTYAHESGDYEVTIDKELTVTLRAVSNTTPFDRGTVLTEAETTDKNVALATAVGFMELYPRIVESHI